MVYRTYLLSWMYYECDILLLMSFLINLVQSPVVRSSHCGRSLAGPSLLPQWDLGTPL